MRARFVFLASSLLGLSVVGPVAPAAQPPAPDQPAKGTGLDAVPTDSFAFVTLNVGKMWDNPEFKPIRDWFAGQKVGPSDEVFGLPTAEIDRITMLLPSMEQFDRGGPLVLVTTKKPYNEARVLKALQVEAPDGGVRRTGRVIRTPNDHQVAVVFADERTILYIPKFRDEGVTVAELLGQLIAKKTDGPLAGALAQAGKHDFALAVDARQFGPHLDEFNKKELAPYLALSKARTVTLTADFDNTARGTLKMTFPNAADAKRAAPVLKESLSELSGEIEKQIGRRGDKVEPLQRWFLELAGTVLKAAKIEAENATVTATAEMPYQDVVAKLATALPKSYSVAVNTARAENNLKQLALGMYNFESTMGFFPGDVFPGADKKLAQSWRVQILPYIEQVQLYNQLDLTKSWDAPANLRVLEKMEMPKVFEIPGRPAPKGHTYFRVFSLPKNAKGKDRPWLVEGENGPAIKDITDGTSNTFMIVEAGAAVPWYKPDVFAYDGVLPLPQLGDKATDKFLVAFGDGSVRQMRRDKLDEKTLRALITIQGGEIIKLP